jgi:hypothetical protein
MYRNLAGLLLFTLAIINLPSEAAPVITSPPPTNGASPLGPFVFTFSEPMNPDFTSVDFVDFAPPYNTLATSNAWSGGNTILTCTPTPAFPTNHQIVWSASGENQTGDQLGGTPGGIFTTGDGTGGGTGGSGTNATTTFSVGKVLHYNQTSSGSPTLDPSTPYDFSGVTALSSNRTATNITLMLPTGSISNLTQIPQQPEFYVLYAYSTDLATIDATFPPGNYTFQVGSVSSNQSVVVSLPTTNTMPQPSVPHVTNFLAAQSVNASQPFVLGWDAFAGGTAADYIDVDIGTAYYSPNPGLPGALPGTARTITIPAGALHANSNYFSRIGFFRFTGATNANYAAAAYRATYTEFTLVTAPANNQLILTNASWTPSNFSFDVLSTNGQIITVEYTNVLTASPWPKLVTTTNTGGASVHIVSPQSVSNKSLFYRARNGP